MEGPLGWDTATEAERRIAIRPEGRPVKTTISQKLANHLLGGLLTDPLTFVSDLIPFTIAGEQFPVCDEDDEDAS